LEQEKELLLRSVVGAGPTGTKVDLV